MNGHCDTCKHLEPKILAEKRPGKDLRLVLKQPTCRQGPIWTTIPYPEKHYCSLWSEKDEN